MAKQANHGNIFRTRSVLVNRNEFRKNSSRNRKNIYFLNRNRKIQGAHCSEMAERKSKII